MLPEAFRRAGRPAILGHRGSPKEQPENTLASFELALQQGADGVELDVLRCGTGEIVVVHDPQLLRLSGKDLRVAKTPWTLLRTLDVGSHLDSRFQSARIPLLTEVLAALPATALVNVELKGDGWPSPGFAREVARLLLATPNRERLLVSSFDPLLLMTFHAAAPELALGWLFAEDQSLGATRAALAPLLHAATLNPSQALCTASKLKRWKKRGYGVCAWTVDEGAAALALFDAGADVIISNRPGRIRGAFA